VSIFKADEEKRMHEIRKEIRALTHTVWATVLRKKYDEEGVDVLIKLLGAIWMALSPPDRTTLVALFQEYDEIKKRIESIESNQADVESETT